MCRQSNHVTPLKHIKNSQNITRAHRSKYTIFYEVKKKMLQVYDKFLNIPFKSMRIGL